MKVHELITELEKHDPQLVVQIQYNEGAYLKAQTVKQKDLFSREDAGFPEIDSEIEAKPYVVIQYE